MKRHKIKINLIKTILFLMMIPSVSPCLGDSSKNISPIPLEQKKETTLIQARSQIEDKAKYNPFVIDFYKPTYILPYYYTASPDNAVYHGSTPNQQTIKSSESKFQFSFKVPVLVNLLNNTNMLYLAYTQLSYWQLYSSSAFFRETDFEPEMFLSHQLKFALGKGWNFDFINAGAVHQSNGFGGNMERTWNRLYLEAVLSNPDWMIRIKPWYVIHDSSYRTHNPTMASYLGYGQVIVVYKYHKQVFSLMGRSFLQQKSQRATAELSYSFPLTVHFNGYVQVFSGYGQSLIEYNHRTNSIGVGISLSDWV